MGKLLYPFPRNVHLFNSIEADDKEEISPEKVSDEFLRYLEARNQILQQDQEEQQFRSQRKQFKHEMMEKLRGKESKSPRVHQTGNNINNEKANSQQERQSLAQKRLAADEMMDVEKVLASERRKQKAKSPFVPLKRKGDITRDSKRAKESINDNEELDVETPKEDEENKEEEEFPIKPEFKISKIQSQLPVGKVPFRLHAVDKKDSKVTSKAVNSKAKFKTQSEMTQKVSTEGDHYISFVDPDENQDIFSALLADAKNSPYLKQDLIKENEENPFIRKGVFKSGFVTILGNPNVGKSTLMNFLLRQKLSIVSSKPQTTRHCINGILTEKTYQLVFIDTPGMLYESPTKTKLHAAMTQTVSQLSHSLSCPDSLNHDVSID